MVSPESVNIRFPHEIWYIWDLTDRSFVYQNCSIWLFLVSLFQLKFVIILHPYTILLFLLWALHWVPQLSSSAPFSKLSFNILIAHRSTSSAGTDCSGARTPTTSTPTTTTCGRLTWWVMGSGKGARTGSAGLEARRFVIERQWRRIDFVWFMESLDYRQLIENSCTIFKSVERETEICTWLGS